MRTAKILLLAITLMCGGFSVSFSQCKPYILIDGNQVLADNSDAGITLPYWLQTGQTLAASQNVYSISVIEFTVSGSSLTFSQVLKITISTAVPANKVWKIEGLSKQVSLTTSSTATSASWTAPGTYNWSVPACVNYICIEVWGAGGGGGGDISSGSNGGGGGGGGGYGYQCFSVTPGAAYVVTVGAEGTGGQGCHCDGTAGGTSSVGALISATGGGAGLSGGGAGTGGAGGTSAATTNVPGQVGGTRAGGFSGAGGYGANGGAGGAIVDNADGIDGTSPGGGGSGSDSGGAGNVYGGDGAAGKVTISW